MVAVKAPNPLYAVRWNDGERTSELEYGPVGATVWQDGERVWVARVTVHGHQEARAFGPTPEVAKAAAVALVASIAALLVECPRCERRSMPHRIERGSCESCDEIARYYRIHGHGFGDEREAEERV